jgi:hypothetical protein
VRVFKFCEFFVFELFLLILFCVFELILVLFFIILTWFVAFGVFYWSFGFSFF